MGAQLSGIDVSVHNGLASTKGQSFAFIRATYGTKRDRKYLLHLANFKLRRLPVVGAYAFGVYGDAAAQARSFLSVAKGASILALDLESDGPHRPRMTNLQAATFIKTVHTAGRKIGLYHSRSGFPSLGQDWNWVADYDNPNPPNIPWAFWQYQGSPLDRNYFNGDAAALLKLAHNIIPAVVVAATLLVNPYRAGTFESVSWYHNHGFSSVGGKWVATGAELASLPTRTRPTVAALVAPTPSTPFPPPVITWPVMPISLTPTMVEAVVEYVQPGTGTYVELGGHQALRFGAFGPLFVLVHGGPVAVGSPGMLSELGWRLAARGAHVYCIDYRSDTWEHAVDDVMAAIFDIRKVAVGPITLVSNSFGGIPALVVALRHGAVNAYVAANSSVETSYPGFPSYLDLAKLRPAMPVSVIRGTGDVTGAGGREAFIAALNAAGHPGLNVLGPGDHTGVLYTKATIDAILATSKLIK